MPERIRKATRDELFGVFGNAWGILFMAVRHDYALVWMR